MSKKVRYFSLVLLLSVVISIGGYAQVKIETDFPETEVLTPHRCGTDAYMQYLRDEHPGQVLNREALEAQIEHILKNGNYRNYDKVSNTLLIPVVVHVVHRTAAESISIARILSNIDVLNQDYNKENADTATIPSFYKPRAGSMGIRFIMANLDPNLQPTNGITYTKTTNTSFSLDNKIKLTSQGGEDIWDRNNYMNIWVGRLNGSILGYAQLPGGPAISDGIVIDYRYFGALGTGSLSPYNRGRTATHEVGHWLGLYHIWGDSNCGEDFVNDTPQQEAANYGCPTYPKITCNNGQNNNTEGGDMYMNYMDYTNDICMKMFTQGQVDRMTGFLAAPSRSSLLSSYALTGNSKQINAETAIRIFPNPSGNGIFNLDMDYRLTEGNIQIQVLNAQGAVQMDVSKDYSTLDLSAFPVGVYFLRVSGNQGVFTRKLIRN